LTASQHNQAFDDLRNTVHECVRVARQRWRPALVGFALLGAAAFWYSQYLPREYAAATVFQRRDDPVLQNLVAANSPYGFEHLKTTLTLDTTGSRALARAVECAGLAPAGTFASEGALSDIERQSLDEVTRRYGLRPGVTLLQNSSSLDTIQVSVAANDPGVARDVATAIRENYIAETRDRIWQVLVRTREFFTAEVARLQQQAGQADEQMHAGFEAFPGLDPTDTVALGTRLETLRIQRSDAFQRRAELEAQITAREQFLLSAASLYTDAVADPAAPPGTPLRRAVVDPAVDKAIADVRAQIFECMAVKRMTAEHPAVKSLQGRLEAMEELRQSLAAAPDPESQPAVAGLSPVQREWQSQKLRVGLELDSLQRQMEVARKQFEESDARVEQFAALYDRIVSQGDGLRQLREKHGSAVSELGVWQGHLARLERVLSAETGDRGTRFTLIEEPKDNTTPVKPRLNTVFLVCLALGLAAATLVVALAEIFDRSFRSVSQVTRSLGVPVLECIGVIGTPRERRRRWLSRVVWVPALTVLVGALVTTAALAYASLTQPALFDSTLRQVDRALGATLPDARPKPDDAA
jgi:uncharacterized protein involved in exopolysaccharide biosynthesis